MKKMNETFWRILEKISGINQYEVR